jgi:hypothetical protein
MVASIHGEPETVLLLARPQTSKVTRNVEECLFLADSVEKDRQ